MTADQVAPIFIALVGAGGVAGAVAVLLRVRPEAGQAVVLASQGALVVQTGVIERLEAENKRLAERLTELERTSANADKLRDRIDELEGENRNLKLRVGELEAQNLQYREELDIVKEQTNGN